MNWINLHNFATLRHFFYKTTITVVFCFLRLARSMDNVFICLYHFDNSFTDLRHLVQNCVRDLEFLQRLPFLFEAQVSVQSRQTKTKIHAEEERSKQQASQSHLRCQVFTATQFRKLLIGEISNFYFALKFSAAWSALAEFWLCF